MNKRKDRSSAVKEVIKYVTIAVCGLVLFLNINEMANTRRTADSIGGEGLFLFLPILWWLIEGTIKDLVAEYKRMWREVQAERTARKGGLR